MNGNGVAFWKASGSGNDFIIIDNRDLSLNVGELPAFARCNPTSENLARYLFGELAARLDSRPLRSRSKPTNSSPPPNASA